MRWSTAGWWSRSHGATAPRGRGATAPGGVGELVGRLLGPVGVGAMVAAGAALVTVVDPEQPGYYPVCPTFALTGLYCPGCGGLRAARALTHGDLAVALHRNPVVVLALPFVVWGYLAWLRRRAFGRPARWLPSPALTWGVLALLAVFTVVRNLAGFGWLAP
jgi:Protein of unknown function (DUF2752)